MADDTGLFIATEGAAFDFRGDPVRMQQGTIVRAGHPIMRGREHMFRPLHVDWDLDDVPPRTDDSAPRSTVRASDRAARTR
jgi:hypothetical protein